jgi:tRNA nucleotidyltransferase (CCA-adding enzyme)
MPFRLFARVLEKIKPRPAELASERRFADKLVRMASRAAPKGCEAVLTGSVAKGTFLREARDIDIFILFPRSFPRDGLEGAVEGIVKRAFPEAHYRLSYAEHPYARFRVDGRRIDLVPAYKISKAEERISAVDRSVLHTRYVLRHMSATQKGGVLLLKKLLRANGLYGAEIKTEGFSGYLCELLVLKYKSFPGLLSESRAWKLPVLVDLEGYYGKSGKGAASGLSKRFASRLVVIDPTDKDRNVAAALSESNLRKFIALAKRLRKQPSESFFFREPETFGQRSSRLSLRAHVYIVTLPKPDVVDDVLWGQLRKLHSQLCARMKADGFEPLAGDMLADDSNGMVRFAIALGQDILPQKMEIQGPPTAMEKHAVQFRRRHKGARFVQKKGRVFATIRRSVRRPEDSLRSFFSELREKGKSHLVCPPEKMRIEKIRPRILPK